MPYPNQPDDISDQAFRVASNITILMSRRELHGGTLGDACSLARMLDREYGVVADLNLIVRVDAMVRTLEDLRAEIKIQIGEFHPEKPETE